MNLRHKIACYLKRPARNLFDPDHVQAQVLIKRQHSIDHNGRKEIFLMANKLRIQRRGGAFDQELPTFTIIRMLAESERKHATRRTRRKT